ncbi:DUF1559 family PulG-like putative transporter [Anatilimnocola floriformis]|uniref:DUF1559 family PulG-like putative transporter n=1 Tax=Anatilimnocola floriformis TaxID=2948575 RepID=UPI0020C457C9|nr:DUF1559 domain-containing protein [Anatilimnocola floriformis]
MRAYVVVAVVLVILAAIIFPAVQVAREAARRMQCGHNMQTHCFALASYHDLFHFYPHGAQNRPMDADREKISWGRSWLVALLTFENGHDEFQQINAAEQTRAGSCYTSTEVRSVVSGKKFMFFVCPSSPLPEWQTLTGGKLQVPSYAGIMGATNESGTKWESFTDSRIVGAPYSGQAAGNGMLVINECLPLALDGWANTIVIGEVSDWYFDDAGTKRNPALSIGNAGDIAFDEEAGWLAGNNLRFIDNPRFKENAELPEKVALYVYQDGPPILNNSVCNLITIDQPIGANNRGGASDKAPNWGTKGIGRCGFNNPLLSAHPAGAMVGFLDGHVMLLTKQTSLLILKKLACRDESFAGCDGY